MSLRPGCLSKHLSADRNLADSGATLSADEELATTELEMESSSR